MRATPKRQVLSSENALIGHGTATSQYGRNFLVTYDLRWSRDHTTVKGIVTPTCGEPEDSLVLDLPGGRAIRFVFVDPELGKVTGTWMVARSDPGAPKPDPLS